MKNHDSLRKSVETQVARMKQAEKERPTLLAQSAYLGVLAVLFLFPVIGGGYLGNWLDDLHHGGYSYHWTVSMIVLGVAIGVVNVYLYIRER